MSSSLIYLLIGALYLFNEVHGERNFTSGIVGGFPVPSATTFPWMAGYLEDRYRFCGASVIAPQWAITAAHCVGSSVPTSDEISVGSLRHDGAGNPAATFYKVSRTYKHPSYNSATLDYDVGLLFLEKEIEFSDTVRPILLVKSTAGDFAGEQATVTGWGLTTERGSPSDILLEVTYPIISNQACRSYDNTITSRMMCAYEPGKDSCNGDSGGPFFLKNNNIGQYELIGIVSWGVDGRCAAVNAPGVYTRVSAVLPWICSVSKVC